MKFFNKIRFVKVSLDEIFMFLWYISLSKPRNNDDNLFSLNSRNCFTKY